MQAALVHERARHDPVIDEVADHEPVVGMDFGLGTDQSQAEPPPFRIERLHAMDERHQPAGQREGIR